MTRSNRKAQAAAINRAPGAMGLAVLLSATGAVMILSATSISAMASDMNSLAFVKQQGIRAVAGLVAMLIAARIDYHRMRQISILGLLVTFVLLVICILPGTQELAPVRGGARRWIDLGLFSFQPSELARFFLVCWAAGYLVRRREVITSFKQGFLPFLVFSGVFFLLIVRQPDLSMAAVVLGLVLLTGFLGGLRPAHLIMIFLLLMPFLTYTYVMKVGYRSERVTSYLEGDDDRAGIGYQAYQSRIALGSGGIAGMGLGKSRQKYFFLPAAHTDFIFAIVGEELGFIGSFLVLGIFCWLAVLGIKIARDAPDFYGFLLASALTIMIFSSAILNMAVVTGLTPTTGLPLPFFSFGGTNLVTTFWAVGILASISRRSAEAKDA